MIRQLDSLLKALAETRPQRRGGRMFVVTPELIVGVLIVIAVPTVIGQVRSLVVWAVQLKRADIAKRSAPAADVSRQLELLQQSVDAMAVEVERISEWQRASSLPPPVVPRQIETSRTTM